MEKELMPKHIAIIMDGNRRWAKAKGLPTNLGHKEGAKTLENLVSYANKIGIEYMTVYAFSTENWKRAAEEVNALMLLLQNYLEKFANKADVENIKIRILGETSVLSEGLQKTMKKCIEKTKDNTGLTLNIAFNYGGRAEIIRAIKNIANDVKENKLKLEDINEEIVSNNLYTYNQPDPDLLIRTSGEIRLSNFLPWQLVYSEFLFVEKNWPDFTEDDLNDAIDVYIKRNRKFGAN